MANQTATLAVTAVGFETRYQWYSGNSGSTSAPIAGATSARFSALNLSQTSNFWVRVSNSTGSVDSQTATITVREMAPITPPATSGTGAALTPTFGDTSATTNGFTAQITNYNGSYTWSGTATASGAVTISSVGMVTVTGVAPATSSTATIVTTRSGYASGSASVAATSTTVDVPTIATQPSSVTMTAGGSASFTVSASGTGPFIYQWSKDGSQIGGATAASFTLSLAALGDAGSYTVAVTNAAGTVLSQAAELLIIPAGTAATHSVVGETYSPGGAVVISSRLSYAGTLGGAAWSVLLPPGWTYVSGSTSQGETRPEVGTTDLLEWAWTSLPASPVEFTYTVQAPAYATGAQTFIALAIARLGGKPYQLLAKPDPLQVLPLNQLLHHAADTNRDFKISLLELTRIIELYNTRNGSTRTGRYRGQTGTEDNFAPDAETLAAATVTLSVYHNADTNRDGRFSLLELTRVIELYNTRLAGARTGRYQIQVGSEDGYAPDPR